jgi:hypothetical protein
MLVIADRTHRDGEEASVIVFLAVCLPVLILLASFVIDVGNWYEHKRHLQLQADAAALAGGAMYTTPCDNSTISTEARKYGGPAASGGGTYNPQVGNTPAANLHLLINSTKFYNNGGSDNSDGAPCSTGFVDTKMTETDAPWFLKLANLIGVGNPTINAHARVNLFTLNSSDKFLPIALPVSDPKLGQVTFVNEATNAVLATAPLTRDGAANGNAIWDNVTQPITLPVGVGVSNIGVNVALSGSNSVTCGTALVQCYTGINFVRGYVPSATPPNGTQPNAPVLRNVTLTSGTCANPYFTAVSCTVGVSAEVDIGGLAPANATMTAVVGGTNYQLTYNAGLNRWLTTGTPITIAPGTGQRAVTINWFESSGSQGSPPQACTNNKIKNPCQGTFAGIAHRAYGAINAVNGSGPIQTMQILQNGSISGQSFAQGTSQTNIVVQIGVQDVLELAKASDPPVQLRVMVGSQNQSVDCDPNTPNLEGELAAGCAPTYARNDGTHACPGSPSALWSTAQPWYCVATQTGGATNQVPKGLNERILGAPMPSSCTSPNHWPNYQPGDPRIVEVFVTPFGSFDGQGNTTVPVTRFAAFYITGWTGQGSGFNNPCQGNGDDPAPDAATIVGHFIKYIDTAGNGTGSGSCDLTTVDSCVLVMTQ